MVVRELAMKLPRDRTRIDRAAFEEHFGASDEDLSAVTSFARTHDLEPIEVSSGRRCVVLSGRLADFDEAFGISSGLYDLDGESYRSHENAVHVPASLSEIVKGVLGLEDRVAVEHHLSANRPIQFTERQAVMEAYGFPVDVDGSGQRIGIVALGGGFHESDLSAFLQRPDQVTTVGLNGQSNKPADASCIAAFWEAMKASFAGKTPDPATLPDFPKTERNTLDNFKWTLETTADVQNLLGFARGADVTVYCAPNDMQGKYTALTTALVDEACPSVLSCSWGTHERSISRNHAWLIDDVLEFAALRGVTLCFSSGDDGDGSHPIVDTLPDKPISAHFPATSPHVLACGGTMWPDPGATREVVWKEELGHARWASGGGVSETFAAPWWQPAEMIEEKSGGRVGRGVPDVAGKADMGSGYRVTVGGIDIPVGGTSSVAPLWAALIARLNQRLGVPIGFLTPLLYVNREGFGPATTSINEGNNGAYQASEGWDPCTGWGTPVGAHLWTAVSGVSGES
jgi:kumamolisin